MASAGSISIVLVLALFGGVLVGAVFLQIYLSKGEEQMTWADSAAGDVRVFGIDNFKLCCV